MEPSSGLSRASLRLLLFSLISEVRASKKDRIPPNVKDEPRRELARSMRSMIRDRSRRWLWRLVGRFRAGSARGERRHGKRSPTRRHSHFAEAGFESPTAARGGNAGRDRGAARSRSAAGTSTFEQRRERTIENLSAPSAHTPAGRSRRVARHSSASRASPACCSLMFFACSIFEAAQRQR